MVGHALTIDREEFGLALKVATIGVKRSEPAFSLRLGFADGMLSMHRARATGEAPASGSWPGAVLIDAAMGLHLHSRLPAVADPVVIRISEDGLNIGGYGTGATMLSDAPAPVALTPGATSRDVLIAVERHGLAAVLATAGEAAVADSKTARREAVREAWRALAVFGVTVGDVAATVLGSLARRTGATDRT